MRKLFYWFLSISALLFFAGCAASSGGSASSNNSSGDSPSAKEASSGGIYYTKVGFWFEKGKSIATNYSTGTYVKAGTKVEITDIGRKSIELTIPSLGNTKITMENVQKYTNVDVQGLLDRTFSKTPTKGGNSTGKISIGMTKQEVIAARGYPPAHETPTLEQNEWHYWKNRWDRVFVFFNNGRVSSIKD